MGHYFLDTQYVYNTVLRISYITTNLYCKSRNLPNTDVCNYSIDLRLFSEAPSTCPVDTYCHTHSQSKAVYWVSILKRSKICLSYWFMHYDLFIDTKFFLLCYSCIICPRSIDSFCTVCPRSLNPFYIISYCIKWVKTYWTYSIINNKPKIWTVA